MKNNILLSFTICSCLFAQANEDSLKSLEAYAKSFEHIKVVIEDKSSIKIKESIFMIENAFWDGALSQETYEFAVDYHLRNVKVLIEANDRSDTMNFEPALDFSKPLKYSGIEFTSSERKEMYKNALANWAIFTYLTDTTITDGRLNFPFVYDINDPFGKLNWRSSQVVNLLDKKKGNCFAFASLFKILSDELDSDAHICIAPNHIYIQHKDHKGDLYNVELSSGSFPSDGSIQTLTYSRLEGIKQGVVLRQLKDKDYLALLAVYLGKSYEHKFKNKSDNFILKCAELALAIDSINLNAMILKHQVLSEKVVENIVKLRQNEEVKVELDEKTLKLLNNLENLTTKLFDLGYRQMPRHMQEILLSALKNDAPLYVADKTPSAFKDMPVPDEDKRFSTLSGGLFQEVHSNSDFEIYGYFTFDVTKRKIVRADLSLAKEMLIDPVAFAFNIDPLAHEFPSWSPYASFADNPIYFVDTDGRSVRPTNSRARTALVSSFDNTFSMYPEIRDRIQLRQVGTHKGEAVMAYSFNPNDAQGKPAMTMAKAKGIINKSTTMTNKQKLIAKSYLKALEDPNVFEFQVSYDEDTDQSYGVMTQSSDLSQAVNKARTTVGDKSSALQSASASISGEASFDYYFNEANVEVDIPNSSYPAHVTGLFNAYIPQQGSETQSVMDGIMFDISGGAAVFDDKNKYSVDGDGNFNTTKRSKK